MLVRSRDYDGPSVICVKVDRLDERPRRWTSSSLGIANLGFLAMLRRRLPAALEFEEAETGLCPPGPTVLPAAGPWLDHAQALADAGLFEDAEALLEQAEPRFEQQGKEIEMAGSLLTAGRDLRLAQGDRRRRAAADEASQWYRQQGRPVGGDRRGTAPAGRAAADDDRRTTSLALPSVAEDLGQRRARARSDTFRARRCARACRGDTELLPGHAETARRCEADHPADRILLAHVDALAAQQAATGLRRGRAISRGLACGDVEPGDTRLDRDAGPRRRPRRRADRDRGAHRGRRRSAAGAAGEDRGDPVDVVADAVVRPPADPELARLLAELRSST